MNLFHINGYKMNENNNALISIIIPTFNRKYDLIRAVNSVLSQSYTNWELIIVDNNSDDGTENYIYSLNNPKIKCIIVNNNGLIAYSRNKGIEISNGEYIAFLDSDDWWHSEKLNYSLKYLAQGNDLVYHDLYVVKSIKHNLNYKSTNSKDANTEVYEDLINNGNFICNSSVVVRKSILNLIHKLPESKALNSICDFQAWLAIAKVTNNFKKIHKVLGFYWIGGGNVTNPERTISSLLEFKNLYFDSYEKIPNWYNYAIGRAYFLEKRYLNSKIYLSKLQFLDLNLKITLKILYMNLYIIFSNEK